MGDDVLRVLTGGVFILGSCLLSAPNHALNITNFKSGLVCAVTPLRNEIRVSEDGVCFETETVHITGQGLCVSNGELEQCTWYGFQFDYDGAKKNEKIQCNWSHSKPGTIGNPDGLEAEGSSSGEFEFMLDKKQGHYYSPNYSLFSYTENSKGILEAKTACYFEGEMLFQYKFDLIYPPVPEKNK